MGRHVSNLCIHSSGSAHASSLPNVADVYGSYPADLRGALQKVSADRCALLFLPVSRSKRQPRRAYWERSSRQRATGIASEAQCSQTPFFGLSLRLIACSVKPVSPSAWGTARCCACGAAARPLAMTSRVSSGRRKSLLGGRVYVYVFVLFFSAICVLRFQRARTLPGCGTVQVWSHRAVVDTPTPVSTCEETVVALAAAGVSHFDVDVIVHNHRTLVAHPRDMQPGAAAASPCTTEPLGKLVGLLRKHFGEGKFYLSMEPKSAWEEEAPFLSGPEVVMHGILRVVEAHADVLAGNCGIILEPSQADDARIADMNWRLSAACEMILPYRRHQAPLPVPKVRELSEKYGMIMPTIELFESSVDDPSEKASGSFLQAALRHHMKVATWVVDSAADLRTALQQFPPGIQGIISNRPLYIAEQVKRMCR